jgi:TRAP-type C4-dicarboxylate transport system permease small subunit
MNAINPDQTTEQAGIPGPKFLRIFEESLVAVSAICILAICVIITVGVITRALFYWSVPDSVILVQELMITCVIVPLACVAAERSHIMVEVFTNMMPDRVQPWLNVLTSVLGFLVVLPFVYGGYFELMDVLSDEAYFFGDLELPEWPGRVAFFVGYIAFILRLGYLVVHDTYVAFSRAGSGLSSTPTEN